MAHVTILNTVKVIPLTTSERQKLQATAEDSQILRDASILQTNDLKAASGYYLPTKLPTSWTCPRYILIQGKEAWNKTRINWHILVE